MKSDRSASDLPAPGNAWTRFWFTPIPTTGLRVTRILSGLLFCAWLLSFLGHQTEFFSLNGWLDARGYQDVQRQPNMGAPVGWSILFLAGDNAQVFQALYWGSLGLLALFTLGIATRVTGICAWVIVVSFLANPVTSYEGDYLLAILAFYLMLAHCFLGLWQANLSGWDYLLGPWFMLLKYFLGRWKANLSVWECILGSRHDFVLAGWFFPRDGAEQPPSYAANFMMRLLQIHFVIILVTSALHRLQIAEWWSGVAFWFPLHPPFETTPESLQRDIDRPILTLICLSATQYAALGWQLALPTFAWREGWMWRTVLIGGAAIYWLGVFFVFKLPLFGPFVFVCCLSFLDSKDWAAILDFGRSMLGSSAKVDPAPEPKKTVAMAWQENIKK